MKTIPVSLIVAGILTPILSFAEGQRGPEGVAPREGEGRKGQQRPPMDFWKSVDTNQDGFISKAEFDAMPRIQNLPDEKRLSLFERLDKDADGKIGREELGRMGGRGHEGQGPPMQKFWELDVDKNGGISFEEFKAGSISKKLPPEKVEQVFQRLDTDHDGAITPKDKPESPFNRGGGDFPKRPEGGRPDGKGMEPRQIIRLLDKNGDGALSFDEFRAGPMVKNLTEDEQEDRFEDADKNDDLKLTAEDFPPPDHRGEPRRPEGPPPARD